MASVAFIVADLIILPIINIHTKYYGRRMSLFILATFYFAMVTAGYPVEKRLRPLGWSPAARHARSWRPACN